ncbi:hypothetical protein ACHAPT_011565 [Fusarium lateritium]
MPGGYQDAAALRPLIHANLRILFPLNPTVDFFVQYDTASVRVIVVDLHQLAHAKLGRCRSGFLLFIDWTCRAQDNQGRVFEAHRHLFEETQRLLKVRVMERFKECGLIPPTTP